MENGKGDLAIFRRSLGYARPYWPHITGVFLFSLLATPLALLAPLPLAMVVNVLSGERMVLDLRASIFRHAQPLSLGYHDPKGTADS
jgi:ABC-type sugar transport system permease subunit